MSVVPDPIFALIEAHRAAHDATDAPRADIADADLDKLLDAEGDALASLLGAQPQTWQAFTAWTVYLHQQITAGDDCDEPAKSLAAIARACQALTDAQVTA